MNDALSWRGQVYQGAPVPIIDRMTGPDEWLRIESLDLEAQGVAHNAEGKVVFVEDALPGEEVRVRVGRRKNQWEQAALVEMRSESAQRVVPRCPHFGVCGGCKMQHLHVAAQVATKQRALEDALWHLGKVKAERMLRPIEGPAWGYRQRARLSVRHVAKKQTVLVGFHERKSSFVADIRSCDVLPKQVSDMLLPLRALIGSLRTRDRLPQIELAVGDGTIVLVLRHLEPLPDDDLARLRAFAVEHPVEWWLQPKGPDTAHRLDDGASCLEYTLPEFGVRMPFRPTDFTQVNRDINRALVSRAIRLLAPRPGDAAIDWCSAASAISVCRWQSLRNRCSASKAAARWWRGPVTRRRSTASARRLASLSATCSR